MREHDAIIGGIHAHMATYLHGAGDLKCRGCGKSSESIAANWIFEFGTCDCFAQSGEVVSVCIIGVICPDCQTAAQQVEAELGKIGQGVLDELFS